MDGEAIEAEQAFLASQRLAKARARWQGAQQEHISNQWITREEGPVEIAQVAGGIELAGVLVQQGGGPAGCAAVAAVHHRQMVIAVVAVEVVGVDQLWLGSNGGNHALELPQPELYAQLHPALAGGPAGMGHQGEKGIEQQHAKAQRVAAIDAQLPRKALQQLVEEQSLWAWRTRFCTAGKRPIWRPSSMRQGSSLRSPLAGRLKALPNQSGTWAAR